MLQNIYFLFHLILQSKNLLIINFILYMIIFLFITNNQVSYCMTEGTEIPEIAEAKIQTPHLRISVDSIINKQIDTFVGYKEIIDKQTLQIKELEKQVENLTKELAEIKEEKPIFYNQYNEPIPCNSWEDYGIFTKED